jgi:hypothetical protein
MLPRWHLLFGLLFAYVVYWFTSITIFQAIIIFLASFLIDVDHYLWYIYKKKNWNLKKAIYFLKTNKKLKTLMIFHTIEFHIIIGLLSFFWRGFFYIFIGMFFHSLVDLVKLAYTKKESRPIII